MTAMGGGYGGGDLRMSFPPLTPVVKWLLIANGAVFVVTAVLAGFGLDRAVLWFLGVSPANVLDGLGLGSLRLVSYQFVHHTGGLGHIVFNMLGLYFFGGMVEEWLAYRGRHRFITFCLMAGIVGGVVHLLTTMAAHGIVTTPLIGASGVVYGCIVHAAMIAPRSRVILFIFPIELRWLAIGLVAFGLYSSYIELISGAGGGVSHAAHLGGALWGYAAFKLHDRGLAFPDLSGPGGGRGGRRGGLLAALRRWRAGQSAASRAELQRTVDRLLDKVHREGISSLSAAERRALDRASRKLKRGT